MTIAKSSKHPVVGEFCVKGVEMKAAAHSRGRSWIECNGMEKTSYLILLAIRRYAELQSDFGLAMKPMPKKVFPHPTSRLD